MTEEKSSSIKPLPLISISSTRILDLCLNLPDLEETPTVFIASYPKSGTTWLQTIVYNLLSNGKQEFNHISQYSPFFEAAATWDLSTERIKSVYNTNFEQLKCRVFNTHLRWDMLPKGKNIKYIYIVRNAQDVVVSFYQHLIHQADESNFNGTFHEFLDAWCDGSTPFGKWTDHIKSWININFTTVLLLKYEDLIKDLFDSMKKVAQFLELPLSDKRLHELQPYCTFQYMKENEMKFQPISVPWKENYHFIRKGVVGDHVHYFDKWCEERFSNMLEQEMCHDQNFYEMMIAIGLISK